MQSSLKVMVVVLLISTLISTIDSCQIDINHIEPFYFQARINLTINCPSIPYTNITIAILNAQNDLQSFTVPTTRSSSLFLTGLQISTTYTISASLIRNTVVATSAVMSFDTLTGSGRSVHNLGLSAPNTMNFQVGDPAEPTATVTIFTSSASGINVNNAATTVQSTTLTLFNNQLNRMKVCLALANILYYCDFSQTIAMVQNNAVVPSLFTSFTTFDLTTNFMAVNPATTMVVQCYTNMFSPQALVLRNNVLVSEATFNSNTDSTISCCLGTCANLRRDLTLIRIDSSITTTRGNILGGTSLRLTSSNTQLSYEISVAPTSSANSFVCNAIPIQPGISCPSIFSRDNKLIFPSITGMDLIITYLYFYGGIFTQSFNFNTNNFFVPTTTITMFRRLFLIRTTYSQSLASVRAATPTLNFTCRISNVPNTWYHQHPGGCLIDQLVTSATQVSFCYGLFTFETCVLTVTFDPTTNNLYRIFVDQIQRLGPSSYKITLDFASHYTYLPTPASVTIGTTRTYPFTPRTEISLTTNTTIFIPSFGLSLCWQFNNIQLSCSPTYTIYSLDDQRISVSITKQMLSFYLARLTPINPLFNYGLLVVLDNSVFFTATTQEALTTGIPLLQENFNLVVVYLTLNRRIYSPPITKYYRTRPIRLLSAYFKSINPSENSVSGYVAIAFQARYTPFLTQTFMVSCFDGTRTVISPNYTMSAPFYSLVNLTPNKKCRLSIVLFGEQPSTSYYYYIGYINPTVPLIQIVDIRFDRITVRVDLLSLNGDGVVISNDHLIPATLPDNRTLLMEFQSSQFFGQLLSFYGYAINPLSSAFVRASSTSLYYTLQSTNFRCTVEQFLANSRYVSVLMNCASSYRFGLQVLSRLEVFRNGSLVNSSSSIGGPRVNLLVFLNDYRHTLYSYRLCNEFITLQQCYEGFFFVQSEDIFQYNITCYTTFSLRTRLTTWNRIRNYDLNSNDGHYLVDWEYATNSSTTSLPLIYNLFLANDVFNSMSTENDLFVYNLYNSFLFQHCSALPITTSNLTDELEFTGQITSISIWWQRFAIFNVSTLLVNITNLSFNETFLVPVVPNNNSITFNDLQPDSNFSISICDDNATCIDRLLFTNSFGMQFENLNPYSNISAITDAFQSSSSNSRGCFMVAFKSLDSNITLYPGLFLTSQLYFGTQMGDVEILLVEQFNNSFCITNTTLADKTYDATALFSSSLSASRTFFTFYFVFCLNRYVCFYRLHSKDSGAISQNLELLALITLLPLAILGVFLFLFIRKRRANTTRPVRYFETNEMKQNQKAYVIADKVVETPQIASRTNDYLLVKANEIDRVQDSLYFLTNDNVKVDSYDFWSLVHAQNCDLVISVCGSNFIDALKLRPVVIKKSDAPLSEITIQKNSTVDFENFKSSSLNVTWKLEHKSDSIVKFYSLEECFDSNEGIEKLMIVLQKLHQNKTKPCVIFCGNETEKASLLVSLDIISRKLLLGNEVDMEQFASKIAKVNGKLSLTGEKLELLNAAISSFVECFNQTSTYDELIKKSDRF